ncbi:MAG: DUF2079 domain-containing protein [Candidatus Firestonebacteria bacterium]
MIAKRFFYLKLFTTILCIVFVFSYFYKFNVSDKFDFIEFEYNTFDSGFYAYTQLGWSGITSTEFGQGVFPINSEAKINFPVSKIDTYLFRTTFYSKKDIDSNQINIFLNEIKLVKFKVELKGYKKYIEFILLREMLKEGNNILKFNFDDKLLNKSVFTTFKFQNFVGYNSHFPKFKITTDNSVCLEQNMNEKIFGTILVMFYAALLLFGCGYIRSKLVGLELVVAIQKSVYSFIIAEITYLIVIFASIITKYHILFSLSSFLVFILLTVLITEMTSLCLTGNYVRLKIVSLVLNSVSRFTDSIQKKSDVLIYVIIGLYFVIMLTLTILKHYTFHSGTSDMALFDQIMLNISNGRGPLFSFEGRNYFNEHASFIFFLLVPFYWILNSPVTLIILQNLFLSLGALAIYFLAKYIIKDKLSALVFSFVYLVSPKILGTNFFDFHQEILLPFFLIFAFYQGLKRNYIRYFICMLIAFSVREDVAIYSIGIGAYFLIIEKEKKMGIITILISIIWFIVVIKYIIFNQGLAASRYSYLGDNFLAILNTIILHPSIPVEHIYKNSLFPALTLFCSVLFLPVFNLKTLILIFLPLATVVLSDYKWQYMLEKEYAIPSLIFIYIAAIYGFEKISKRKIKNIILLLLIYLNILNLFEYIRRIDRNWFIITEHTRILKNAIIKIPKTASVSAQTSLLPHLSRNEKNYLFPHIATAEYVIIDEKGNRWPLDVDKGEKYFEKVRKLRNNKKYTTIYSNDGVNVFKKIK